jgi:hypothetical protein
MANCFTIIVLRNKGDAKKVTKQQVLGKHFFKGFTELVAYFSSQIVGLKKLIKKCDLKSGLAHINTDWLRIKKVLIEKVKIRTPFSCFSAEMKKYHYYNGF